MGQKERDLINTRLKNLEKNERLFRINAGMGWTGNAERHGEIMVIKNPRPFHGAPDGWPDLSGWTEITVTPEMVGKKIAVFTGEEVKTGKQKIKKDSDQDKFREIILRMGGVFRVISS